MTDKASTGEPRASPPRSDDDGHTEEKWAIVSKAAKLMKLPRRTLYTWASDGAIKARRGSRGIEVELGSVRERAAERRPASGIHQPSAGRPARTTESDATRAPSGNSPRSTSAAGQQVSGAMKTKERRVRLDTADAIRRETERLRELDEFEAQKDRRALRAREQGIALRHEEVEVEKKWFELRRLEREFALDDESRVQMRRERDEEHAAGELARQQHEQQVASERNLIRWMLERERETGIRQRAEALSGRARERARRAIAMVANALDLSQAEGDTFSREVKACLGLGSSASGVESYGDFVAAVGDDLDGFVAGAISIVVADLFGAHLSISTLREALDGR